MKISQIPTCQGGSIQFELWLIQCQPTRFLAPLLDFGTIAILQETYRWGTTIIKYTSIKKNYLLQTTTTRTPIFVGGWIE